MRARTRTRVAASAIPTASICVGTGVWLGTSHPGFALICGLFALLGLISAYSLIAYLLRWPTPRWSDIWAPGYLLP